MLRRTAVFALLLILPCSARADGLPGSGSYAMDRVYTYAGCSDDGRSCHKFGFHVETVLDPTGMTAPQQWVLYDYFDSIWLDGTTDEWLQYGHFVGMNRYCSPAYRGVASSEWSHGIGEGGCENRLNPDVAWAPGPEIRTWLLMRPTSINYEQHYLTMTATPEPASIVLMGTGLLLLAGVARRLH